MHQSKAAIAPPSPQPTGEGGEPMSVSAPARDAAPVGTTKRGTRLRRPGQRTGYAYIAPFFIVFIAFSLYPWLATAWVSLHDTRMTTYDQSNFIGLDNYHNLSSNKFFWN